MNGFLYISDVIYHSLAQLQNVFLLNWYIYIGYTENDRDSLGSALNFCSIKSNLEVVKYLHEICNTNVETSDWR